ncbi:MAG: hypothetical protein ACRDI2_21450 [Chloroflexota bacterium]
MGMNRWSAGLAALTVAGIVALSIPVQAGVHLVGSMAPLVEGQIAPITDLAPRLPAALEAWVPRPSCRFVLGFAIMRDTVGPNTVGACLEDETFDPATGTTQQPTVGGLLVWRKADGALAFTDGYWTWLKGPYGIQQRLNTQRYCWEADANPLRCQRATLSVPARP